MYKRFVQDSLSISRLYWTVRKINSAPSRHPCAPVPPALTRLLRQSPARRDGSAMVARLQTLSVVRATS